MINEAFIIGLREGFKICIVWLIFYSYLFINEKKSLIISYYAGLSLMFSASLFFFFFYSLDVREYISSIISTSFAIIFLFSVIALFRSPEIRPQNNSYISNTFLHFLIFIFTVLFFLPDSIGTLLLLRELSIMKEARLMTYSSAITGLMLTGSIFLVVNRFIRPHQIGVFFKLPQLLLFLSMVKLFGSGIKGMVELSLMPSVQRGLMKFFHDFIHQIFVFLMVPDHPMFKTTVWNFVGIFFAPNFASTVSLIILLIFPLVFLYHTIFIPLPEPDVQSPAMKRKIKRLLLTDRRKKALPVILFICIIVISWFSGTGDTASQLYKPKPKPVVEDKGLIVIPVKDPTMDLMDGRLHKFSLIHNSEEIRIIVIKKSDNKLSVCLDACEICPPEGYGQREDHVVCLYCATPIPVNTLGEPGGCNPIPLSFSIDEKFIRVEMKELLKKWEFIKSGESKEAIR